MIVTIYGVINYKRLTRLWFNLNFEFQICSLLARIIPAEYLSELRTAWAATPQKFESECSPPVRWLVSRTDGSVPESALLPLATWWNLTHHQHPPVLGYGSRALRPTVLVKTMMVMLVRAAPLFPELCLSGDGPHSDAHSAMATGLTASSHAALWVAAQWETQLGTMEALLFKAKSDRDTALFPGLLRKAEARPRVLRKCPFLGHPAVSFPIAAFFNKQAFMY